MPYHGPEAARPTRSTPRTDDGPGRVRQVDPHDGPLAGDQRHRVEVVLDGLGHLDAVDGDLGAGPAGRRLGEADSLGDPLEQIGGAGRPIVPPGIVIGLGAIIRPIAPWPQRRHRASRTAPPTMGGVDDEIEVHDNPEAQPLRGDRRRPAGRLRGLPAPARGAGLHPHRGPPGVGGARHGRPPRAGRPRRRPRPGAERHPALPLHRRLDPPPPRVRGPRARGGARAARPRG